MSLSSDTGCLAARITRAAAVVVFSTLAISCFASAQSSGPAVQKLSPADYAWVGCYELKLGRWWPWSLGEDAEFVTPPSHLELRAEHGADGFEQNGFVLRGIPAAAPSRRKSYWLPRSGGVDLVWTDGFTGLSVALSGNRNELHGWARPHFDASRFVAHFARVIARRTDCSPSR